MKFWVSFRSEALQDVESAIVYFSIYNDPATRFNLELERCIERLRDFPESHQTIHLQWFAYSLIKKLRFLTNS